MSHGHRLEATYEDGYVLRENDTNTAQFGDGDTFTDILNHRPEAEHGGLVRLSVVYDNGAIHDVLWTDFPEEAEPVYYRRMQATIGPGGASDAECLMVGLGARWPGGESIMEF